MTLEVILLNYPNKSSYPRVLLFPKSSILQIPGVWSKFQFLIMGRKMTLNQIEHDTLRSKFNEPRIHVALVCAAKGCPPLRREPFVGSRLDEQLDDQAHRFLSNPMKFHVDRKEGTTYLSSIFKWFGKDFVKAYGTDRNFSGHSREERALLKFISRYLESEDRNFLDKQKYRIKYIKYDWSLNEKRS
ncbi:DUF547 domain-containing protein [bacterium]|nr:DUF547 domain-containing protein [bacterium]